ncbi:MAG: tyrosine-type recombinase/integrase, partial [Acidimicrobiia bacterium]
GQGSNMGQFSVEKLVLPGQLSVEINTYAVSDGIIDVNPVEGVKKPADKRRQRRLRAEEYAKLGRALVASVEVGETPQVIDGVWLLALSGCRLGEIVNLKWGEVDSEGGALRLADNKEGASIRPAGKPFLAYLAKIGRTDDCATVLRPARAGQVFGGLANGWRRIAKRAGFSDVTPHTLRQSFASVAADLGYAESTVAAMLGHAAGSVTSRYMHHLDSVLVAAADRVAQVILGMMLMESGAGSLDVRVGEQAPAQ